MAATATHRSRKDSVDSFARERELNQVEDQFIAELFRLIRFADADVITSAGLGRSSDGIAATRAPRQPDELQLSQNIWLSLSPAQHRRILAKTLACLSLPSVLYFHDASLFLLFVRPTLSELVRAPPPISSRNPCPSQASLLRCPTCLRARE
jgi:hypothetical protein